MVCISEFKLGVSRILHNCVCGRLLTNGLKKIFDYAALKEVGFGFFTMHTVDNVVITGLYWLSQ